MTADLRYNLWLDPDNTPLHRAVEKDLERFFIERFADFPHIRLFGADPYDYDAPFNRLYLALIARGEEYCAHHWQYFVTPSQLHRCFFSAVGHSNKFLRDPDDGDPTRHNA